MIKSLDFLAKCSKYFIGKSNFFCSSQILLDVVCKTKKQKKGIQWFRTLLCPHCTVITVQLHCILGKAWFPPLSSFLFIAYLITLSLGKSQEMS